MEIEFITGMAVITPDSAASARLYRDALGLPLAAAEGDDYLHSEDVAGARHFGVWPLSQAAQACFGTETWPPDRATPQASLEFEVSSADAVQPAIDELRASGCDVLHDARREPWGQTVARLQSPEGVVVGISYAPAMH